MIGVLGEPFERGDALRISEVKSQEACEPASLPPQCVYLIALALRIEGTRPPHSKGFIGRASRC